MEHKHTWIDKGNYSECLCGRKRFKLLNTQDDNILKITKINGQQYTVRKDRKRYFFPFEWKLFINQFKNDKHRFFFLTLLHTGARAMEAINLRTKNFDLDRGTVTFETVKQKKAKKTFSVSGKSRTFFVSDKFIKEAKKYINKHPNNYLFLNVLPLNYESLDNLQKKKYYQKVEVAYNQMLKRKLKNIGISDWKNFSLHNIRKTYGNWMRIYNIRTEEICYRLGHDLETYLAHYGSPMIFNQQEKIEIMNILGDVK